VKHKSGETVVTTWFALPDRLYDEPDELADWARAALRIANASSTVKMKRGAAAKKIARPPAKRRRA
jgi:DNA transformation protein